MRQVWVLRGAALIALAAMCHPHEARAQQSRSPQSQAQPAPPPQATHDIPQMGGEPQMIPGPKVIGLTPNEVELSRLKGAGIIHNKSERLGQVGGPLYANERNTVASVPIPAGTITGALYDPAKHAITFVIADPGNGKGSVAVPWSAFQPADQPHDQFVTGLTAGQIASATPVAQAIKAGKLMNAERDLIGRKIALRDGKTIGTLGNLVFETQSGRIDYAVVDDRSGIQMGANNAPQALPWSKIERVTAAQAQPLIVALQPQQLAQEPLYAGFKAQETQGTERVNRKLGATGLEPP